MLWNPKKPDPKTTHHNEGKKRDLCGGRHKVGEWSGKKNFKGKKGGGAMESNEKKGGDGVQNPLKR